MVPLMTVILFLFVFVFVFVFCHVHLLPVLVLEHSLAILHYTSSGIIIMPGVSSLKNDIKSSLQSVKILK